MLTKVVCKSCKEEAFIPLYFYDVRIIIEDDPRNMRRDYIASAMGKAICPCCGKEIYEHYRSQIFDNDIKELATRGVIKLE